MSWWSQATLSSEAAIWCFLGYVGFCVCRIASTFEAAKQILRSCSSFQLAQQQFSVSQSSTVNFLPIRTSFKSSRKLPRSLSGAQQRVRFLPQASSSTTLNATEEKLFPSVTNRNPIKGVWELSTCWVNRLRSNWMMKVITTLEWFPFIWFKGWLVILCYISDSQTETSWVDNISDRHCQLKTSRQD